MPRAQFRLILLACSAALAVAAVAAPVKTPHVEAELVPESTAFVPGQPMTVALRLRMADGWHTYWRNPGDSGLPTTIAWNLPAGATAGPIQWPVPHALPVGPLVNYGYEGTVLLLSDVHAPDGLKPGDTVTIAAKAEWLVCKETCIPEEGDLELTLPVAERADPYPQWGTAIAAARDALPRPVPGWLASCPRRRPEGDSDADRAGRGGFAGATCTSFRMTRAVSKPRPGRRSRARPTARTC